MVKIAMIQKFICYKAETSYRFLMILEQGERVTADNGIGGDTRYKQAKC